MVLGFPVTIERTQIEAWHRDLLTHLSRENWYLLEATINFYEAGNLEPFNYLAVMTGNEYNAINQSLLAESLQPFITHLISLNIQPPKGLDITQYGTREGDPPLTTQEIAYLLSIGITPPSEPAPYIGAPDIPDTPSTIASPNEQLAQQVAAVAEWALNKPHEIKTRLALLDLENMLLEAQQTYTTNLDIRQRTNGRLDQFLRKSIG